MITVLRLAISEPYVAPVTDHHIPEKSGNAGDDVASQAAQHRPQSCRLRPLCGRRVADVGWIGAVLSSFICVSITTGAPARERKDERCSDHLRFSAFVTALFCCWPVSLAGRQGRRVRPCNAASPRHSTEHASLT
jgi:hypothetical protein